MGDFLYICIMRTLFKKIFGKKEVTKEDKVVKLIVEFIKNDYNITEYYKSEESEARTYHTNDMWPPAVFYYKNKELSYNRKLAQDIHNFIPDDRLLQPDSKLMGDVFEKLYNYKVRVAYGYSQFCTHV
jgi:hypothetical protein